jgi:putative endonuclease
VRVVCAEDPNRALARRGGELAAAHFRRLGFSTVARDVHTRCGEIDLIASDGSTLVFAHVRTCRAPGGPARAGRRAPIPFGRPQRARLRDLALAWLADASASTPTARTIRFDAVGVILDDTYALVRLEHHEGAS